MTTTPEHRGLLRLVPHARGKRSPVTCELKCGNACAHEAPNRSDNDYFPEVASRALSRRKALGAAGAGALALALAPATPAAASVSTGAAGHTGGRALRFGAIDPVPATVDAVTVPKGWTWRPLIRWGDPLFDDAPTSTRSTRRPRGRSASSATTTTTWTSSRWRDTEAAGRSLSSTTSTPTRTSCSRRPRRRPCSTSTSGSPWPRTGCTVVELRRRAPGRPWSYVRGAPAQPADHRAAPRSR